jgi:hypothetical protein
MAPTLDGISRPSLDTIKQASSRVFSKAQLMVGLKAEEDTESQQSEPSRSTFVDEAAELLCPELTFQQVRGGGVRWVIDFFFVAAEKRDYGALGCYRLPSMPFLRSPPCIIRTLLINVVFVAVVPTIRILSSG